MKAISLTGIIILIAFAGCENRTNSGLGFRLPKGDIDAGKTAFVELKCHTCHSIKGHRFPDNVSHSPYNVILGGEVGRVKTYGQLVTAVIHPSNSFAHGFDKASIVDGKLSPMPGFNHVMTVEQMVNIAAFLQPQYTLREPDYGAYPY